MTVPVQIPFNQYIANGATTEFPFTFLATNETHLKVFLGTVQQTTGFTVTGVGDDSGGSVAFTTPPLSTDLVTIRRNIPLGRTLFDYQNSGDFSADVVDLDFDTIWQAIQQISSDFNDRILKFPETVDLSSIDNTLPAPQDGRVLTWSNGSLVNANISDTSSQISFINTIPKVDTKALALASMGLDDGQGLLIMGNTAVADGGGGAYTYDASSALLANGGTILALDTLPGRLIHAGITPVTVKTFGAVGDGIADDTTAVQEMALTGRDLYFTDGTYLTTANVPLSASQRLYGEGTVVITPVLADGVEAFTLDDRCEVTGLYFKPLGISPICLGANSKTGIRVTKCEFELGDFTGVVGTTLTSSSSRCINFFSCSSLRIQYNKFNNGWNDKTYDASTTYAGNNLFRVVNVENLGESSVNISFNEFNNVWTPIYCSNTNALKITHNDIDTTADTAIFDRCTSGTTVNKKINFNTLVDIGKAGIKILDSNNLTALGSRGQVIGNTIDGYGLKLSNPAILSANNFDFGGTNQYLRADIADRATSLTVSDNITTTDRDNSPALQLANINKVTVSDNIFTHPNSTVTSTYLQWCSSVTVSCNTLDIGAGQLQFYSCEDAKFDTNEMTCYGYLRLFLADVTNGRYIITGNFIDNEDTLSGENMYGIGVIQSGGDIDSMIATGNTVKTTIPFEDSNAADAKSFAALGTEAVSNKTILDNNIVIFTDGTKKQKIMFGDILNPVYFLGSQGSSTYNSGAKTLTIKPTSNRTNTDTVVFT